MQCQRRLLLLLGVFSFILGGVYYLLFRDISATYLLRLLGPLEGGGALLGPARFPGLDSLPSVSHLLGLVFIALAVLRPGRAAALRVVAAVWVLALTLEAAQGISPAVLGLERGLLGSRHLLPGTFDWADLLAITVAVLLVMAWVGWRSPEIIKRSESRPAGRSWAVPALLALGLFSAIGSSGSRYKPIYMSYDELRTAVKVDPSAPLREIGKIYLYGGYLFVNSRNQGLHIYDNTDPTAPKFLTFITIPGNLDLAVKDGFLYADSYIDLVVIDLTNPTAIREVKRFTDVFPYDPYQNIDDGVYFYYKDLDQSRGVVVGYTVGESDYL